MNIARAVLGLFILFISLSANALDLCFIAKENDKIIQHEGECKKRYGPQSTFKIPLAIMGFDSGILVDENSPVMEHKPEYKLWINMHKDSHTPKTWIRDSVVWYSQELTKKLGMPKFQNYLNKFDYGNMDASGGLTECWLSSSLQISPVEQTEFLQRFLNKKLLVSDHAYQTTKKVTYIMEMTDGWKLYGKTGFGTLANGNNHGWFVGFIEKNNRRIVFATHLIDHKKESGYTSFRARNEALNKLWYIINELEK